MKDDAIPFEKVTVGEAKAITAPEPAAPKPSQKNWKHRRVQERPLDQSGPDIKLLHPWIAQLPAEVRPKSLIIQYPRIANRLAELWRHPIACEKYLNELMIDGRGDRQGFPSEVAQELAALQIYFNKHVLPPHFTVWGDRIGG